MSNLGNIVAPLIGGLIAIAFIAFWVSLFVMVLRGAFGRRKPRCADCGSRHMLRPTTYGLYYCDTCRNDRTRGERFYVG